MLRPLLYLLVLFSLLINFSCNKEKLKAPTASFIVVPEASVTTTVALQGAGSHKITDIWFYVDGKFQGVYPIGSVMPVVASNSADIVMYAGIKNNGISSTRLPYSFYKGIEFTKTLEAGKTYSIYPAFEYRSGLNFTIDDFESTGTHFISVGDSAYTLTSWSNQSVAYGGVGRSLFMGMSDAKPTARMQSSTPIVLPLSGATVYLELDYKCNQQIIVGVRGYNGVDNPDRDAVVLTPTEGWNKVYIQLTSVINAQPTFSTYKLYVKAYKDVASPEIYIDNVKLIVP